MATTYEVTDPSVQIRYSAELEPEKHSVIERSVQAMAAHSTEETDRLRAVEAEPAKVAALLDGLTAEQIAADPVKARALEELLARPFPLDLDSASFLRPENPLSEVENASRLSVLADHFDLWPGQLGVWSPPYHFTWSWHRTDGSPPFNAGFDPPTGQVALDGRSGSPGAMPGGAGTLVEAHAGYGLFFRFPHDGVLIGVSREGVLFSYAVAAQGLGGGNATVEGGIECSILEDGQWRTGATHRFYRKRVSGNEADHDESPGFIDTSDPSIRWPVRAGHDYTFNVGVWVYCDHTAGVGRSAAQSLTQASIANMFTATPI
ncbi:hypothetical protein [Streptomyces mirabilis]|uniref:hypothetical protein n=1 Tax=Streptomyces mirabilis TaxID=68239 RepID=UPI00367763D4